ncbi:MAG: oligosaccharide flippase family protein [Candidatus Bathyarchaeota archaeon]
MADSRGITAAHVVLGSTYLTIRNVLSTLVAVFGFALMARLISVEEMGAIAGLTLLTTLAPLFSDFGLTESMLKHVSEVKGRGESITETVASALLFRTVMCLIVASAFFLLAPTISEAVFKTSFYAYTIKLLSIDIIPLSINSLLNSILLGAGRMKAIAFYGITSIAVRWISITALLLAGAGLNGVIIGWIIGDLTPLPLLAAAVVKATGLRRQALKSVRQQIPTLLRFAAPLYLSAIVAFIYVWYDKAVVLAYLSLTDLGIYNTTYQAFSILVVIAMTLGSSLLPYYGMAYGKKDHAAISSGIRRASRYTMLTIFPLTLGLLAAANPIITLFAGKQYEEGWTVLATLSLFGLVYGLTPALSNILLIYGKTKTILFISLIPVAASLLMLPLVLVMGLTGLALMRGTGIVLSGLLTAYFVNRLVKIRFDWKAMIKSLASSTIMAITILILQLTLNNKNLLPLYTVVGAAIYFATLRILRTLDREDAQLIENVIGKKYSKYINKILNQ